jgi:hypothetical protein
MVVTLAAAACEQYRAIVQSPLKFYLAALASAAADHPAVVDPAA